MNYNYKEVYFSEYCRKCEFENTKPTDDPCDMCLAIPARQDSHKPEYFEEKRKD